MTAPLDAHTRRLVELALAEDIGPGDVTTEALIDADAVGFGRIVAREPLVVSGAVPAEAVFHAVEPALEIRVHHEDGSDASPGDTVMEIEGPLRGLLTAERTALNFLQRLSGIASFTRVHAEALAGSRTRLLDTRKTTPGWRVLEKAAVRHGGGSNHRVALFDGILIKDNHLRGAGGVAAAVARARENGHPLLKIEVEVETLQELSEAVEAGADMVLLDNMDDAMVERAVAKFGGRVPLEASGGITLPRLSRLAGIGVDYVSCGVITQGARAVDLGLDLD